MTSEKEAPAKDPGRPDLGPALTPTTFRLQLGSSICYLLSLCIVLLVLYRVSVFKPTPGDQVAMPMEEFKLFLIIAVALSMLSGLLLGIRRVLDGTPPPKY